MKFIKSLFLVGSLWISFAAHCTEIPVSSTINKVTVYLSQAKIEHEASVLLKTGMNEIVLKDLTPTILPNSIQAKTSAGVMLSISQRQNYNDNLTVSEDIQFFQDSIRTYEYDLNFIKNAIEVNILQQKLITSNNPLPSNTETGFTVADLQELVIYYKTKMLVLKDDLVLLNRNEQNIEQRIQRYKNQISELQGHKTQNTGEIVLKISSTKSQTIEIQFNYLTSAAGWRPSYNMNASGNDENIKLSYIGHVFQNTGVDWKDIQLVLSSSNPGINQSRPILEPWYISKYQPVVYGDQNFNNKDVVTNLAYDKKEKSIYAVEESPGSNDYNGIAPPATTTTSELAVEYTIPYTADIKSNNKENDIWIKDVTIPASYQFHAVPKLSSSGYLLAKIANWGNYNLLSGTTNLFYDGMYIGNTTINPHIQSDTLLLSMGRDERIVVSRSKVTEACTSKILGKLKKHTYTYEIKVTNNKSKTIEIEVLDHFPVSTNEEIKVEMLESLGAELIESSGKISWNLNLKPNESKTLRFSFEVSYPKEFQITGL